MLLFHVAAAVFGLPLIVFGIGWSALGFWPDLDGEERFAASWGIGFATLAASQFVAFLTGANQAIFNGLLLLGLIATASVGCWRRTVQVPTWPLATLWFLGFVLLLCIQCLLPVYVGAGWYGDWMMHYENVLVFRGERPVETRWIGVYSIASRTPLFNLAAAFVASLLGDDFWVYQMASSLLNYTFVAGLYLVLRDLFGRPTARLALVLAPLNIWLMHEAWFTWPKMLAAYYALMGLHFYLRFLREARANPSAAHRWLLGCWVFSLLGFMTHQVVAVYLTALVLHAAVLAWRERGYRIGLGSLLALAASAALIVGPWYGWLAGRFGSGELGATPLTQMDRFASFTPQGILGYMAHNGGTSVAPTLLAQALWNEPGSFASWYNGLTDLYFSLIPGALTLSLTAFLLVAGVRRLVWRPEHEKRVDGGKTAWSAVCLLLALGILGGLVLHPARADHGVAHSALFPAVTLLIGLAWGLLAQAPRRWRLLVASGIMVEGFVMLWSHVWLAQTPETLDPLGINVYEKTRFEAVLLADLIGSWRWSFAGVALLLQVFFCALLFRWLGAQAAASPAEETGL